MITIKLNCKLRTSSSNMMIILDGILNKGTNPQQCLILIECLKIQVNSFFIFIVKK